jgi:hypothetical protein
MRPTSPIVQSVPLPVVVSNVFGRYPKISVEQCWNMIQSDNWMVDYAGYANVSQIQPPGLGVGRALFSSSKAGVMFSVVGDTFFIIPPSLIPIPVGTLATFSGEVTIDENDANQIAICDEVNIYIYNYVTNTFSIAMNTIDNMTPNGPLSFVPGYINFQDGYFIAPALDQNAWFLSNINNGLLWNPLDQGTFQTKPDNVVACVRFPAKGNLLFVIGNTVTEAWYDTGNFPFPYQRSQSYNIDYGTLNSATIAAIDSFIVWLGANENSGPVIMYSTGGDIKRVSNDGIDFKFSQLTNPKDSYGFLFKQDGHLIYQLTFPTDNLTYAFDFNTGKFSTLCNEQMNYHIAKQVAFFNNTYYFVSNIDGNLYEFSTKYTNYNYGNNVIYEIPRILITKTFRLPDNSAFIANSHTFTIEEGEEADSDMPRVDLSVSYDGGVIFGNIVSYELNSLGNRRNRIVFWRLGYTNEITLQYRLWGFGRFVLGGGELSVYQGSPVAEAA